MTMCHVEQSVPDDPERALWVPGRRKFLFMFGAAVGGIVLPAPPPPLEFHPLALESVYPPDGTLVTPEWVTQEVARYFVKNLGPLARIERNYNDRWVQNPGIQVKLG